MPDFTIKISVTVHARYDDTREAWTDAASIATHIHEECGNLVDDVSVVDVQMTGEGHE